MNKAIDIELLEISGFRSALESLRLPYAKECRSTTDFVMQNTANVIDYRSFVDLDDKDKKLISTLVKRGDEHAKPMRGIVVWLRITAGIDFFVEEETYRCGHERLFSNSTMHSECKGLSGDELDEEIHKIPYDRKVTKVDFFSYQCLRNIYIQRRNHRKNSWQQFCNFIETLPYFNEFIYPEKNEN